MMLTLLTSVNQDLDSVDLCSNSMLNSPLLKPLHEYTCTLSLKLPQFCCLGTHCFGKDPQCSPHLLQVINPSFSRSVVWLCLLARYPPITVTLNSDSKAEFTSSQSNSSQHLLHAQYTEDVTFNFIFTSHQLFQNKILFKSHHASSNSFQIEN